ncbi:hypothetical protein [Desulfosediminicola flagellatus]|uniref:hypothetical protein n=1 Tax=Desulfosediminicola flagellatus TaxID=2569541 RepID=UPI0010AC44E5|nr:hypothetical protein [Desulfosediminicola flagellatus]
MTSQNSKEKNTEHVTSVSDETILKISKEIAVKFIEVGRITPASFNEQFSEIYTSIASTVRKN